MITQIRIVILLIRPSLVVLFGLFAATGVAEAGRCDDPFVLTSALAVVVAFMLFSVLVNDSADRAIDRVNLEGDRRRPLVTGYGNDQQFMWMAVVAASVALVTAWLLGPWVAVVVACGLVLSAGYSLRPIRIADRGALASLLLPAGYVAVPYLVGILSVRPSLTSRDLVLGLGLYLGFIGRILLKDFRDVRGDALFGKRTFLVRHGRRATCACSAVCWVLGATTLLGVRATTPALVGVYGALLVAGLVLLRALADERGARRDERLISAVAIIGRGLVVVLFAHFSMSDALVSTALQSAVLGGFMVLTIGQAATMARIGPVQRAGVDCAALECGTEVPVTV